MKRLIISALMAGGLMLGSAEPGSAATTHRTHRRYQTRRQSARHRRNVRTARRVGVGAAGGAAIGAIAGGGKGAAIGAIAGGGAGAIYDSHKRSQGR
jgi:outer membrane lipoprotein SlyB